MAKSIARLPVRSKHSQTEIDRYVGSRIRIYRMAKGLSQEQVGEALGLTFQQVQKYEKGVNRAGPSVLMILARVLEVPVQAFFPEIDAGAVLLNGHSSPLDDAANMIKNPLTLRLVKAFNQIEAAGAKTALVGLAEGLARDIA